MVASLLHLNFLYPQLAPQRSWWLTWRYAPSLHSWGGGGGGHHNLLNLLWYSCTCLPTVRGNRAAPGGNPVDHLALPLCSHYIQAALFSCRSGFVTAANMAIPLLMYWSLGTKSQSALVAALICSSVGPFVSSGKVHPCRNPGPSTMWSPGCWDGKYKNHPGHWE